MDDLRGVLEVTPDAAILVDGEGVIRQANETVGAELGYAPEELEGEVVEELLLEDDRSDHVDYREAYMADPEPRPMGRDLDLYALHADGSRVPVEISLSPVNADGEDYVVATIVDVTEQRERERELQRQRDWARQLFETSGTLNVVLDLDGRVQRINDRGCEMLGYDRSDIRGEDWFETVLPDAVEAEVEGVFEDLAAGDPSGLEIYENPAVTASGETRRIKWHNTPLYDAEGEVSAVLSSGMDVTERVERERALETARKRYRTLLQAAPDPVFVADAETGEIVEVNQAAEALRGQPREEIVGLHQADLHPEDEADRYRRLFAEHVAEGGTRSRLPDGSRIQAVTGGGEEIPVEISVETIDLAGDRVIFGIFRDVTERVRRERELREKNERLDAFANLVTHDLRNPLDVAQMRTDLLQEEYDSDHLDMLAQTLERMETIVEESLTLAREGDTVAESEPVPITDCVDGCWEMVATADASLAVAEEFTVHCDPDRVDHVFENLFRNAMEHGGEDVTVTVGRAGESAFYVEDDGPGIPPDDRESVFDPGRTSTADGTGFGLSIVRRIAEGHGWEVSVTASAEGGARFEFHGVDIEP